RDRARYPAALRRRQAGRRHRRRAGDRLQRRPQRDRARRQGSAGLADRETDRDRMSADLSPPLAALLELTHRCPLQFPYCSTPLELERAKGELSTAEWLRVMEEAAELGILQ